MSRYRSTTHFIKFSCVDEMSSVPNSNRKHQGNPLDVISMVEDGEYYNDLSDEQRVALDQKGEQAFTDFIVGHLLD